jgi:hypothetical protein
VTQYITASTKVTSTHWGPHEGPHSDIFTGLGGYSYAGKTYKNSTHQSLAGCASCHMGKSAANGDMPDHSMRPRIETCQTAGCHVGQTSFDVAGGQGQVRAGLQELRVQLNNAGLLTRSAAAPYLPLQPAELADKSYELDLTLPTQVGSPNLTADQAGALYNYLLVARGSAAGVHNPVYTKELLFDAISVYKVPVAIATRP